MNTKMLLAALAAAVASFFIGWLVYGILLAGFYEANMIHYDGLMKPMEQMSMLAMIVSNMASGLLIAWALWRMGVNTVAGGFMAGAIIGSLIALSLDMYFLSMMNMYANHTVIVVDICLNAIISGVLGAVAAMVLGSGAAAKG